MAKLLVKSRTKAYLQQNGLCIYCELPMWLDHPQQFALQYELSISQAKQFQCTAEHLKARHEGGTDDLGNIAAACYFCNTHRHKAKKPLDPIAYKSRIKKKLTKGGWNRCFHIQFSSAAR